MAPQLSRNLAVLSGRKTSRKTPCRDYPLRPVSSLVCPFGCIQQERQDICGTENINRGYLNNGGVESLPGENVELAFIHPT
ncbi:hypothetical protein TNCV_1844741 [Trichonephila clavipes]|nr:hypothetical protein TNCV_1844741 [Trichonephila clavipes]